MYKTGTYLKQAETLRWQGFQGRLLHFQEVGVDLLPSPPMDTHPGYGAVPVLEEGIQLLQTVKPSAFEGIVLEVVTATLNHTLFLRVTRPAGKRYKAPVLGKSSVQLIDIGVIQTGSHHTGLKVIKSHDTWYSTPIQEGILLSTHEGYLLLSPHRLFKSF
jgi:hypothetical protein